MPGELRIPNRLLRNALASKKIKQLRLFAAAKLEGHRSEIKPLCECLKIQPKTCQRLIKWIVDEGWAGTDGKFLFPRSWAILDLFRRRGLYITTAPKDLKKFEALCFVKALKKCWKGDPHSKKGRVMQTDLPTGYLSKALGLKERRFKTLKAQAQRYKYISVTPQYTIIGKVKDYSALKKNLHGIPIFKRGKYVVTPQISKIKFLI